MKMYCHILMYWSFILMEVLVYGQQDHHVIKIKNQIYSGETMWVKNDSLCISQSENAVCFKADEVDECSSPENNQNIINVNQRPFNTYCIYYQTAFTPQKGKIAFRNFLIFENIFEKGLTNNICVQVGNTVHSATYHRILFTPFAALKGSIPIVKNKITIGSSATFHLNSLYNCDDERLCYSSMDAYSGTLTLGDPYNFINFNFIKEDYNNKSDINKLSIGAKSRLNFYFSVLMEVSFISQRMNNFSIGFRHDLKKVSIAYGIILFERKNLLVYPYLGTYVLL